MHAVTKNVAHHPKTPHENSINPPSDDRFSTLVVARLEHAMNFACGLGGGVSLLAELPLMSPQRTAANQPPNDPQVFYGGSPMDR